MNKKVFLALSLALLAPCSLGAETISQKRANLRTSLLKNIQANKVDAAQADYNALMKTFYDARQPQKSNLMSYQTRYETLKVNKNLQDKNSQMLLKQLRGAFLSGGSVEVKEDESVPTTPRGEPGSSSSSSTPSPQPSPGTSPRGGNGGQQPTGGPGTPPPFPPRVSPLPMPSPRPTQKEQDLKEIQKKYKKLQELSGDSSKSVECNDAKDALDVDILNFAMNYGNETLKAEDGTDLNITNMCATASPRPLPAPSPRNNQPDVAIAALDAAAGFAKYQSELSQNPLISDDDAANKDKAEKLWANIYSIYNKQSDQIIKDSMKTDLNDLRDNYGLSVQEIA